MRSFRARVRAADFYTPDTERGGVRAALAAACLAGAGLAGTGAAAAGGQAQRALAVGFAASAHSGDQLAQVRSWLSGGIPAPASGRRGPWPDRLDLDGDLRGRLLRTLAARDLATEEDLDALFARFASGKASATEIWMESRDNV